MPSTRSDVWRELRTKADITDDGPWTATDQPESGDLATVSAPTMKVAYVIVYLTDGGDVIDPEGATCTIAGIKLLDLDHDGAVDASDLVGRTGSVEVNIGEEVRIPLGGALRFTAEVSDIADAPAGADGVLLMYREAEA